MRKQVQKILLVSSLYDSFILAQDGQLNEMISSEFIEQDLYHAPGIVRVAKASEALETAAEDDQINLVIATMRVGDMDVIEFAETMRESLPDIPVVLLAYDTREMRDMVKHPKKDLFERIFLWQGDFRILISIVKSVEDKWNVDHDSRVMGVQSILMVEDNIRFYSAYLPLIYTELFKQSHRLISEGLNLPHKLLRMRARPKILLSDTYEEGMAWFDKYEDHILGVISDIEFPMGGEKKPDAGLRLAQAVRERKPDMPVLLQSFRREIEQEAHAIGADFVRKDSATLLRQLRRFMMNQFAFGDFVFRLPDGTEIDRSHDMKDMEEKVARIPSDSLLYHAEKNHFSRWLKARTEFALAQKLRPKKVSDFPDAEALRTHIVQSLKEFRRHQRRGMVTDFSRRAFEASEGFAHIGTGSMGGKARGLAFMNHLVNNFGIRSRYPDVEVSIPPTVVLCTDLFDDFLDQNGLRDPALNSSDEKEILRLFLKASFPPKWIGELTALADMMREPLAVRSSSLLEDSQYQPFAGIYSTFMLPNNHTDKSKRLNELLTAIKKVYASTFSRAAKSYIRSTPYRLEEEKMAVIVQQLVGAKRDHRFYPDISGVARSYNFYPSDPMKPEDGVASIALGLGEQVVTGGAAVRFCPRYPKHMVQMSLTEDILANTQREFYALNLHPKWTPDSTHAMEPEVYRLSEAEEDGVLSKIASTYSPDNDAIYDGTSRPGTRLVTFAPILKHNTFPLAPILSHILEMGRTGMGNEVELEFAVNLSTRRKQPKQFGILQLRPLVLNPELQEMDIDAVPEEDILCRSDRVLGVGILEDIRDAIVVDRENYDRGASKLVAEEVSRFNLTLEQENRKFLLIGVGRWGTADPWLGIPVDWDQIDGAAVIVETGFKDFIVTPSQGAHFFQNITAFNIGYFTINPDMGEGFLDWEWLLSCNPVEQGKYVRRLRFDEPITVMMNGRRNQGVIIKPGSNHA
ncbi:histidine kinase [bacterium]|nr:histidine kinase [bacterium]